MEPPAVTATMTVHLPARPGGKPRDTVASLAMCDEAIRAFTTAKIAILAAQDALDSLAAVDAMPVPEPPAAFQQYRCTGCGITFASLPGDVRRHACAPEDDSPEFCGIRYRTVIGEWRECGEPAGHDGLCGDRVAAGGGCNGDVSPGGPPCELDYRHAGPCSAPSAMAADNGEPVVITREDLVGPQCANPACEHPEGVHYLAARQGIPSGHCLSEGCPCAAYASPAAVLAASIGSGQPLIVTEDDGSLEDAAAQEYGDDEYAALARGDDPFGPQAYLNHKFGCMCPDCRAARMCGVPHPGGNYACELLPGHDGDHDVPSADDGSGGMSWPSGGLRIAPGESAGPASLASVATGPTGYVTADAPVLRGAKIGGGA